jgi:hypothetical protein
VLAGWKPNLYYLRTEIVDSSRLCCQVRMRGSIEEVVMSATLTRPEHGCGAAAADNQNKVSPLISF